MIETGNAAATDPDVAERMAVHRSRIKQLGCEIRMLEDQQAAPARRITPKSFGVSRRASVKRCTAAIRPCAGTTCACSSTGSKSGPTGW